MKIRVKKIKWANWIIYSTIFILFTIFFILPSINFLNVEFHNSYVLIFLKLLIGLAGIIAILTKYIKEYTQFIINLDINKDNVISLKWTLRKNNLIAFLKTTLSITPFLLFAIIQGSKLNSKIITEFMDNISINSGKTYTTISGLAQEVSKTFIVLLFEKVLHNSQQISFIVSLFIVGMIFSSFLMVIIYGIYKISMNNYFKEINKQFNKFSKNLNIENKDIIKQNFVLMVEEKENKEKTIQNERLVNLYTILNKKQSDFWKEVKKSTTPPNFN
ncbi:hypothetical protein [Spiroplasma endosymbiont of Atherix ibis]|uniref:hypothetical protein n=1 Tax=Spiroplasma endosymbiont of Atherix ibis TaxID=3066291 RepID=UPI0030CDD801